MLEITTTDVLEAFCQRAAEAPYVTVDTEFLRERTYYAQLCLIQIAYPGEGDGNAALVDVLADGIDLTPVFALMADTSVVKVFHAARQDLEILWHMGHVIPTPLFDTQVAAMVCGFGEQVGYETLVRRLTNAAMDKSSRFTDWSQRPLSGKQKTYALADVTHLREVYEKLSEQLASSGRSGWVEQEMAILTSPETYEVQPQDAWKRVKTRNNNRRFLALVRELAAWREAEAQSRDVPRNRLLKDDALLELAANRPTSFEALSKQRLLLREARKGKSAEGILAAISTAMAMPDTDLPKAVVSEDRPQVSGALMDLLKVLLKARCESEGVAQKLVATVGDLEAFAAAPDAPSAITSTWRREVFGDDAKALIEGRIGLTTRKGQIKVFDIG